VYFHLIGVCFVAGNFDGTTAQSNLGAEQDDIYFISIYNSNVLSRATAQPNQSTGQLIY
jgi:hypothetical protein